MLIDGKAIASDIFRELKNEISHLGHAPHLTIFSCAPSLPSQKYVALKKKKAEDIGIQINVIELPEDISTEDMISTIQGSFMQTDGVVVQLPLPDLIDTDKVLAAIPPQLDVDAVNFNGTNMEILPPVVGAINEMSHRHGLFLGTSSIAVLGEGRLVGGPSKIWIKQHGWQCQVINEITPYPEKIFAAADVLILGAGQAHMVKPDMVKEGVVIFDAGTSEDGGTIKGDADPSCAEKADLITPVPGGIGPVTLAILFRNLVLLHKKNVKS